MGAFAHGRMPESGSIPTPRAKSRAKIENTITYFRLDPIEI